MLYTVHSTVAHSWLVSMRAIQYDDAADAPTAVAVAVVLHSE